MLCSKLGSGIPTQVHVVTLFVSNTDEEPLQPSVFLFHLDEPLRLNPGKGHQILTNTAKREPQSWSIEFYPVGT